MDIKELKEFIKDLPDDLRVDVAHVDGDHLKLWMPVNKIEHNTHVNSLILWYETDEDDTD